MSARLIVFDIETYRTRNETAAREIAEEAIEKRPASNTRKDLKIEWDTTQARQARAAEALAKTSVDPLMAEILCVCIVADGEQFGINAMARSEAEALKDMVDLLNGMAGQDTTIWVGHNVAGFDLPIILNRLRRHGILPPKHFPTYNGHWRGRVFDTMLRTPSKTGYVSLDNAALAYGVDVAPPPMWNGGKMCGARVGEAFEAGEYDLIMEYCMSDVLATYRLYLAMTGNDMHNTYEPRTGVAEEITEIESSDLSEGQKALAVYHILDRAGLIPRVAA